MSKRRADFQLDRDGRHKAIEEELDRKAEEGKFSANQLSSANTAGRKIAKLRKPLNKPEPAALAPASDPVPAVNVFANLMKHSNKFSSVLIPEPSEEVDKMTKFKAINFNFSQKVSDSIKEDPQCDLSKACEKYLEYAKEALTSSSTFETKENPPVKETPFKNFKPQLSKPATPVNNSFEQLKKLKPASEKPSITELPTSDEESEKPEIKGPQFTLSNKPVAKKPAFVFGAALAKKQAAEKDSDESDVEEPKGPTFTFGGQVKDPVFKFEKKDEKASTEVTHKVAEKPKFTFNLRDSKNETSKPAATDGASTFKFNLNDTKSEDKQSANTLFNFGAKDDQPKSVPTFNFGKPAESKPASTFSFGAPADSKATPVPTFSFNEPAEEKKPAAFSFGKPQQSENTSTFGMAKTFSFDKKEESTNAQGTLPTSNFKFSLPFNETKVEDQSKEEQAPAEGNEEKQEPLKLDENEEQTENLLYSQKAQLKVYQPENKESPYTTKGVGMFKILQSKEDSKKYRFLLRTEGMGNIILNTYIISAMTYEQIPQRKKTIKMPIFNNDTKKLETYLLTVKTEDDANEIIKVIENAQANMK